MGIEFRESSLLIGPKCNAVAKKGMVFNVYVGLANLTNKEASDKEGKVYALFIGDTVLVNEDSPASILTQSKKKVKNVGIFLKEDDEDDEENEENEEVDTGKEVLSGRGKRTTVLDTKLRSEHSSEEKRKQHQKELAIALNDRAKERLAKQGGVKEAEKVRKSTVSYKSINQMPREPEVKELKLYVGKFYSSNFLLFFNYRFFFYCFIIPFKQTKSTRRLLCQCLVCPFLFTFPPSRTFRSLLKATTRICESISFIRVLLWAVTKAACTPSRTPLSSKKCKPTNKY